MQKKIVLIAISIITTSIGQAQNGNETSKETKDENKIDIGISPRLNFNLVDDQSFTDMIPTIFFGFNQQLSKDQKTNKAGNKVANNKKFFLEAGHILPPA